MLKSLKLSFLIAIFSVTAVFAIDMSQVKILSAEKLDYKDGDSILIGNVKVQLGDYFISAPKVFIDSDDSGKPFQARFIEDVSLESKTLNIHAPEMNIDLTNSILKCFSTVDTIVETTIVDKNSKQAVLKTWYQEFNYKTGLAKGNAQRLVSASSVDNRKLAKTNFVYDKLQVESDDIEMQTKEGKVEYAVFLGDAIASDDNQRTEAQEIYFFPAQNIIKAETDVRIVYADEKKPAYVFSDAVIYEKEKNILSAFSRSNTANSKIYSDNHKLYTINLFK